MATEILTVTQDETTIDLLLWRRFRREVQGQVEKILDATPGLADEGVFLPIGAKFEVDLSDFSDATTAPVVRVRRLWG